MDATDWGGAFAEHSAAVYHYALVVVRHSEDARDVMQTVFERAWQLREHGDMAATAAAPGEANLALWQAIGTLPTAHRAVVGLFYLHGFSIEEIAGLLDVPVGTVGSRLHTARRRLREVLGSGTAEEVRA